MTKNNENASKRNNSILTSSSSHETGTTIYTLKDGKLTCSGEFNNIARNPTKILFCFDASLNQNQILSYLSIKKATIDKFDAYHMTADGRANNPDYYVYEVFHLKN